MPHLVLEYVEGPSLATLHDESALTVPDVVMVGLQLASSLRHLHRRRLVHLDVKPGNVVVRHGRAVLIDLGSAHPGRPGLRAARRTRDDRVHAAGAARRRCGHRGRRRLRPRHHDARAARDGASRGGSRRPAGPDDEQRSRGQTGDDEVLAVLHAELVDVGSSLWPDVGRTRCFATADRRSLGSARAHLAIPRRRARRPRPHRRGDRQLRRRPPGPPARRTTSAGDRRPRGAARRRRHLRPAPDGGAAPRTRAADLDRRRPALPAAA